MILQFSSHISNDNCLTFKCNYQIVTFGAFGGIWKKVDHYLFL